MASLQPINLNSQRDHTAYLCLQCVLASVKKVLGQCLVALKISFEANFIPPDASSFVTKDPLQTLYLAFLSCTYDH